MPGETPYAVRVSRRGPEDHLRSRCSSLLRKPGATIAAEINAKLAEVSRGTHALALRWIVRDAQEPLRQPMTWSSLHPPRGSPRLRSRTLDGNERVVHGRDGFLHGCRAFACAVLPVIPRDQSTRSGSGSHSVPHCQATVSSTAGSVVRSMGRVRCRPFEAVRDEVRGRGHDRCAMFHVKRLRRFWTRTAAGVSRETERRRSASATAGPERAWGWILRSHAATRAGVGVVAHGCSVACHRARCFTWNGSATDP